MAGVLKLQQGYKDCNDKAHEGLNIFSFANPMEKSARNGSFTGSKADGQEKQSHGGKYGMGFRPSRYMQVPRARDMLRV